MKSLQVLSLGTGNVSSVVNAFRLIGVDSGVIDDANLIDPCEPLVLPGVGAYCDAMSRLRETGAADQILKLSTMKVPILGICLGMQVLASKGNEPHEVDGLGLIGGEVKPLRSILSSVRVPNTGWVKVNSTGSESVFSSCLSDRFFYHIHSYYFDAYNEESVRGVIDLERHAIPVAVQCDNVWGVQFHPEKSQDAGIDLLAAWKENYL